MKGISIIICCYNSACRLPQTLKHIANQEQIESLNWELIIINNNSSDNTVEVAKKEWQKFGYPAPLKLVNEPNPGLSFAREKGIEQAKYDILLWCDDDNWFCDTYVSTAYDIINKNPKIGALGGWCEATFEADKPIWFDKYAKFFAVSKQGKRSGDITNKKGCVYGAGMVIRKSHNVKLRKLGFRNLLGGRKGASLSSGEDTEYCYALRLLGYKIWFDERLYFKHFMPKDRIKLEYISRLRKAMTYSNFILWPYLDLLNNEFQSKNDFLKKGFSKLPFLAIRKLGALLIGNMEQKEAAKKYFRITKYRFFKYRIYKQHMEIISEWKSRVDNV